MWFIESDRMDAIQKSRLEERTTTQVRGPRLVRTAFDIR